MMFISIYDDNGMYLGELKDVLSDFCKQKKIEYQIETVLSEDNMIELQEIGSNLPLEEFRFREGVQRIALEQIAFIESCRHILEFTVCYQLKTKKFTMLGKLNDIQKLLAGKGFVRTHQSYLVNLRHIKSISSNELVLQDGRVLSVSRSRYREAKKVFLQYQGKVQDDT